MVRKLSLLLVLCMGVNLGIAAVPEDFALKADVVPGTTDTVIVVGSWTVGNPADPKTGVQGWSWGLRHDKDDARIGDCAGQFLSGCDLPTCPNVECPPDMARPGPDNDPFAEFNSINIYEDGVTHGVVLDLFAQWSLMPTDRFEMLKIKYVMTPGVDCTEVKFVWDLGNPTIDTVYVHGGLSIEPAVQESGKIGPNCGGPTCPDVKIYLEKVGDDQVGVMLDTFDTTDNKGISGVSFGLKIASADLEGVDIVPGQAFTDLNHNPRTEGFWGVEKVAGGITLGMVVDLQPQNQQFVSLPDCTKGLQIAVASFACKAGVQGPVPSNVSLADNIGTPPRLIVVDVDGESTVPPALLVGGPVSITVQCGAVGVRFIRGDANQDGRYTVSDGIAIAKAAFNQGSKLAMILACEDSADANDDGQRNTADAIYLLNYLFLSGPAMAAPFGACGLDTVSDSLPDCQQFQQCP